MRRIRLWWASQLPLGRALILIDESESAVSYLNVYLESSLESDDVASQGKAYSALAQHIKRWETLMMQSLACNSI